MGRACWCSQLPSFSGWRIKSEVVTMGDSDADDTVGLAFVLTEVKIEYTLYIQQSFEVFRTSWIASPSLTVKSLAS